MELVGTEVGLVWLCEELKYAAENGRGIKLSNTWERYTMLGEKAQIEIPSSFLSRKSKFKEKLLLRLANVIDCIPSGRESLLIPTQYVNLAVS